MGYVLRNMALHMNAMLTVRAAYCPQLPFQSPHLTVPTTDNNVFVETMELRQAVEYGQHEPGETLRELFNWLQQTSDFKYLSRELVKMWQQNHSDTGIAESNPVGRISVLIRVGRALVMGPSPIEGAPPNVLKPAWYN